MKRVTAGTIPRGMGSLIFVALLALGGGLVRAQVRTSVAISPIEERAKGEQAHARFLKDKQLSTNAELVARVNQVGQKVAKESDRSQLLYQFSVIQGKELQAFSFPGGIVCLREGLVRFLKTDDELAFVIGHEIAHAALRHHIANYRLSLAGNPRLDPDSAMLKAIMELVDRDQDSEADKYGALYAVRADFKFSSTYGALESIAKSTPGETSDAAHREYRDRIYDLRVLEDDLKRSVKLFGQGTAALKVGEIDNAIGALEYFVTQFSNSVSGRVNLGSAHLARFRKKGGTPMSLAETLPILPTQPIVIRSGSDTRDLERARQHYQHAIEYGGDDSTALAGIALVEMRLGQHAEARKHLNEALSLDPDSPQFRLCSGNAYYVSKDYVAAEKEYRRALCQRPGWPDAKKNLALAYQSQERRVEAIRQWTALENDKQYGREARSSLSLLENSAE